MGNDNSKSLTKEEIESLKSTTHYSHKEIQRRYNKFQRDYPRGVMTLQDFIGMYAKLYPTGDVKNFATHMFCSYDKDGNGEINFREFLQTLSRSSHGTDEEKRNWAFNVYDLDREGSISLAQVTSLITAIHKLKGKADIIEPKREALQLFKSLELDEDTEITKEEFLNGASISQALLAVLKEA